MDGRGSNPGRRKTGFGVHPTFYPIGIVGSLPGDKAPRA
jgi:hypothetical protein